MNKGNKHYSKEFKESILKKLESQPNLTVSEMAKELNIPKSTIYQWQRTRKKQETSSSKNKSSGKWSTEDKFHVVLETYSLTEEELSTYCRKKGLYVSEVKEWQKQCLNANLTNSKAPQELEDELKDEKKKIKSLEKELSKKEKALAETAALLVLRKKSQAIWGDPEED